MTNVTFKALTEDRNKEEGSLPTGMKTGQMIKDAISEIVTKKYEMTEAEKAEMDQRIEQKLKLGKKLTAEEMEYIKMYNPELYKRVLRIEMKRKGLRNQLKHAKSKEEVQNIVSVSLAGIDRDPDKEYMAAMINKEVSDFQKSAAYAKLPNTVEEARKKKKTSEAEKYYAEKEESERKEMEQGTLTKLSVFTQMQMQCEQIGELVSASRV